MKLKIFIQGQTLRAYLPSVMVADTVNYFSADIIFKNDVWNGLTKYAHFQLGEECYDIPLQNDRIPESAGLNLKAGSWSMHIHGDRFEDGELVQRITTNACFFTVQESGCLDGSAFPSVPPDLAAELLARVVELEQNGGSGGTGADGKSAYEVAVEHGFEGSEQEWLESLNGEDGKDGQNGKDGSDYVLTESDKQEIAEQAARMVDIPEVNFDGYATEEFVKNKIAEAELGGEEVDLSGYAQKSEIPTKVSQLENDKGYLTEHQDISGKLNASELPTAINTALSQAKASGEFDGKNGKDGQDGYTPQKNVDYFDGKDGKDGSNGKDGTSATHSWNGTILTITSASGTSSADLKGETGSAGKNGSNGADGVSPTVAVSKSGKVTTISITDKNGTKTATINDGADGSAGSAGKDGTSVTVKSVSESTADGGSNVVTFSDGKTLTVKNGSKGSTGAAGKNGQDGKDYSFDPTVYGLPVLYLTGDISPIAVSKDNKVTVNYAYGDRSGTCTLKGQGATSYKMAKAFIDAGKAGKFNYTINFDTAFEVVEGWGAQKKYCLKANWIDHTHSRNVVSCKLWGMIVKSRSTVPAVLQNLPNGGAIDGFPCIIMLNGEFHGLYTWNIPKDGWMFGMVEDTTKTQAIVAAKDHTTATQFKEAGMSGYEVEFASDEDNVGWVETSLTRLIDACINSWGGDLDTTVAQYLDWDSAIDYYIHAVVEKATDCVDKNFLLVTFDGVKWYFSDYDRDSIHGLNWDASGTTRPVSNVTFLECAESVRVFELIKRFKTNALKARYKQLRGNVLSESRIMEKFENFAWAIPSPVLAEDVKVYPTILGSSVNTIDQIGRFVRQRLEAVDKWIDALPAQETPVEPEEPVEIVNLVPTSTDTDGSIYNGTGYKDNVRLSSSGGVSGSAQNGSVTTGFMPYTGGGIVRIKGATWAGISADEGHYYINAYDANKTFKLAHAASDPLAATTATYDSQTGVTTFDFSKLSDANETRKIFEQQTAYIRLNAKGKGSDLIVTVNQEIV